MTTAMEDLLRKHVQDGIDANEKATEQTKRMAKLNAKLIFINGAGQLPRRGLKELDIDG
jgi:hypothetical protein